MDLFAGEFEMTCGLICRRERCISVVTREGDSHEGREREEDSHEKEGRERGVCLNICIQRKESPVLDGHGNYSTKNKLSAFKAAAYVRLSPT